MKPAQVPALATEHYVLSKFIEADAADVLKYASDPHVAKTVAWEAHRNEAESLAYVRRLLAQTSFEEGRIFVPWTVREAVGAPVIGSVTFTELGPSRGQVGFVFHFDYWHRNTVAEAVRGVMDWVFTRYPRIDRIQGRCFPSNTVSHQVLENSGMKFEGVNRAMLRVRGEARDISLHAITRTDWQRLCREGNYLSVPYSAAEHI